MASFNPAVPAQNAQDFTNTSKAISPFDLKADESGKIKGEGYGKLFDEGVTALDNYNKSSIAQEAYNKITPITDSMTEALQSGVNDIKTGTATPGEVKANLQSKPGDSAAPDDPAAAGATTSSVDLPPPPQTINTGIDQISRLQEALKLKPDLKTYYSGQVAAIQKEMRAANPGYRAYIDQEVSKITGGVDANSHLRDLMTQVAQATDAKNNFQQKIETDLIAMAKEGWPDAYQTAQNLHNGKITVEQAGIKLNGYNARTNQLKQGEQELNYSIKNREDTTGRAKQIGTQFARDTMNDLFQGSYTAGGAQSNQSIAAYLQDVAEGRAPNDPVQLGKLADTLQARKTEAMRIVSNKLFRRPTDSAGNPIPGQVSVGAQMGNDAEATLKQAGDSYDQQINLIRNGQMGLAFTLHNNNMAMEQQAENKIRTSPLIGDFANNIPAMQKLFGNTKEFNDFVTKNLMLPETEKRFQKYFQDNAAGLISGKATVDQVLKDGLQQGPINPQTGKPQGISPMTTNQILNLSKYLGDPRTSPEFKESLGKSVYTPGNQGMLDNFKMDYTDDKGVTHSGKYAVYARFWSPNITNELAKNRTKSPGGEQLWNNYVDSGESQFYKVFRDDVAGMKDMQETPGLKVKWIDNPGETPQLKFEYPQGQQDQSGAYYGQSKFGANTATKQIETRINNGLRSLGYMQQQAGKDTSAYMLGILKESGADLTKMDGIPAKIMKAIISSRPLDFSPDEFQKKTSSK